MGNSMKPESIVSTEANKTPRKLALVASRVLQATKIVWQKAMRCQAKQN